MLSALLGLPWLLLDPPNLAVVWPYVLASAATETVYFGLLVSAYRAADFSLVYPIARGAAPAFLTGWVILFLGERPTPGGLAGLGLIIVGLMIVGARSGAAGARVRWSSIALALGVALCISLYSAIDGAAVRLTAPGPYTITVFVLTTLLVAPLILRRYGWAHALRAGRALGWRVALIGGLQLAAYVIVLGVYRMSAVSYAGAIRETSIVFAAVAGRYLFKERLGARRAMGAIVIVVGIATIALMG